MEGTGKAYRTVSWKRYLLKTESPRVKKFLESRGNEVFYQVCKAIDNATLTGTKRNCFTDTSKYEKYN